MYSYTDEERFYDPARGSGINCLVNIIFYSRMPREQSGEPGGAYL
jgi:hypothetical protein